MNLGTLFNTLGAAIFDGVPEDARIDYLINENEDGTELLYIWYDARLNIITFSCYEPSNKVVDDSHFRLLWEKPHHPAAWTAPF